VLLANDREIKNTVILSGGEAGIEGSVFQRENGFLVAVLLGMTGERGNGFLVTVFLGMTGERGNGFLVTVFLGMTEEGGQ